MFFLYLYKTFTVRFVHIGRPKESNFSVRMRTAIMFAHNHNESGFPSERKMFTLYKWPYTTPVSSRHTRNAKISQFQFPILIFRPNKASSWVFIESIVAAGVRLCILSLRAAMKVNWPPLASVSEESSR